jgi:NTP pyrophosphatase (non-canonical NTP hydrolase)
MNFKEFINKALRTENRDFNSIIKRISLISSVRMLHGSIGISTEAGELLDAVKKYIFYGKEIDKINVKEELGDILYYTALIVDEIGLEFGDIMETVVAKLQARYPEKFTEEKANNRNLQDERNILSQGN